MNQKSPIDDEMNRIDKLPKIQFGTRHSKGLDNIKFDGKHNEIILPMACEPKHVKMTDAIKIANFILNHAK